MKYIKKPVEVEALKWDGNNTEAVLGFMRDSAVFKDGFIEIATLEGKMRASVGDYIIKGIHGEFYPCKPDIFCETYEKADH